MEELMAETVKNSMNSFMNSNAIFLCERLCAQFPSEANLQLLATCYLMNNQASCAYHILKGRQMPQSRYLFAYSCYQMNLLDEAEVALCPDRMCKAKIPNGAAGHHLLGLVYRHTSRSSKAIEQFMQALIMDPLLWTAYKELCNLGALKEENGYFTESIIGHIQHQHLSKSYIQKSNIDSMGSTDSSRDSSQKMSKATPTSKTGPGQYLRGKSKSPQYYTPLVTRVSRVAPPPPPPRRKNAQRCLNTNALGSDASSRLNSNSTAQIEKISSRLFPGSYSRLRRGVRLSKQSASDSNSYITEVAGCGKNNSFSKFLGGIPLSPSKIKSKRGNQTVPENSKHGKRYVCEDKRTINTKTESSASSSLSFDDVKYTEQDKVILSVVDSTHDSKAKNGLTELLRLLKILGEGYRLSCLYRSQDALEEYHKLAQHQYNTEWVLSQVGKAYFELGDYPEADCIFDLARRVAPYMLEGMDIYSTILFHLKEKMKLSYLAQSLISLDRLSPQAWVAMGNRYSLEKDHETALRNFRRAVQLNSRFSYAEILCGHEYALMDNYEDAIVCYQNALNIDERDYKAWYGLGVVYLHLKKYTLAKHHFQQALCITPHSSVIMCYLSMAFHSLKRNDAALHMIEKAIIIDKKTPLPLYQKARILLSLEKFDDALKILKHLMELTPSESSIYALMGQIYKKSNMHGEAVFHFGVALDLKPPATDIAKIKLAMEDLHLPDDLEEDLGFNT